MDEKVKKQLMALIQAAQQGNEEAIKAIQQIKQQADQGDQKAAALMQAMNAIAQQMQAQPAQPTQKVMARLGAKLNYIRTIRGECPEGQQLVYFKQGGRVCKKCIEAAGGAKVKDGKKEISDFKKKKACSGSKMRFQPGGKTPKKEWTKEDDKKLLKYRLKGTKNSAEKKDSTDIQTKWNKLPEKIKKQHEVQEEKCGGKAKKHFFGGILGF